MSHVLLFCSFLVISSAYGQQNYENIAIGKTYNISTKYLNQGEFSASDAANGNTSAYFPGNCIHTDDYSGWWEVDLGSSYPVYSITVWGRQLSWAPGTIRLYPFNITVDGQQCVMMLDGSLVQSVTCSSVIMGRRVRLQKTGGDCCLNLCELQIYVCRGGFYGEACSKTCPTLSCQQCHRLTGQCTACNRFLGLAPPNCTECKKGLYGSDCSLSCQHPQCEQCDRQTGKCTACLNNLQPPACTECLDGFYEFRSISRCIPCTGQCYNNTPCDKTTGKCTKCPPGRTGNTCSRACPRDKYGQDCEEVCGYCRDSPCNVITGECPQCNIGYQLPFCKQECDDGHYGYNCNMTCGRCKGGAAAACNKTDGRCPQDLCEPGWDPPNCTTARQDGLPVAAVTSLSIVVSVFVCTIAFIGIFWYRKRARRTSHISKLKTKADMGATNLGNLTEDRSPSEQEMQQSEYEDVLLEDRGDKPDHYFNAGVDIEHYSLPVDSAATYDTTGTFLNADGDHYTYTALHKSDQSQA